MCLFLVCVCGCSTKVEATSLQFPPCFCCYHGFVSLLWNSFCNIGAEIITNSAVGVPYYNYSIMGPKTLF